MGYQYYVMGYQYYVMGVYHPVGSTLRPHRTPQRVTAVAPHWGLSAQCRVWVPMTGWPAPQQRATHVHRVNRVPRFTRWPRVRVDDMADAVYRSKRWKMVRLEVLERDGWRCQLCGELIDRYATPRSPMSATVDHVVAVLDGGSWYNTANLRAAHLVCNSTRANRGRAARPLVKYQTPRAW